MPDGSLVQFVEGEEIPRFFPAAQKYHDQLQVIGALIIAQNKLIAAVDAVHEPWKKEDLEVELRSLNRWRCATEDKLTKNYIDISRPFDNLVAKLKRDRPTARIISSFFELQLFGLAICSVPLATLGLFVGIFFGEGLLGVGAGVTTGTLFTTLMAVKILVGEPVDQATWTQTPPAYDKEGCYSDHCSCRMS